MQKQKNSFRITTSLQHRTKKGLLYGITWKGQKRKMKVSDLLKVGLFIMALVLTVFFAGLISERYNVVHIQKELLQYDRAVKIEEVKIKKEAWLKAYDNGEYLVEGVK